MRNFASVFVDVKLFLRFYRAAWNASADQLRERYLSVCRSVHPPVKRVDCDKTEKKICSDVLYHTKDHLA